MNRGAAETAAAIKRRGLTINAAARLLEADEGTFSKILRGADERKPGRTLASRIFAEFGISPALWDDELPDSEQPQKPSDS